MRKLFFVVLSLPAAFCFLLPAAAARTGYTRAIDPAGRRERRLVREPDLKISDTVTVAGFWRPRSRSGYRWIPPSRDDAGRWQGGYWEPLNRDAWKEKVTLPGYWGPAGRYGYVRITTQERPDDYLAGSWELMNSFEIRETPLRWVPGYWNRRRWVPGYWRIPRKEGHTWVAGYYRPDGRRQEARWEPVPEPGD